MAEPDLDAVIRFIAKKQTRTLMEAAKKRRDHFIQLAAKAKNNDAKGRYKRLAKETLLQAAAMARRLQTSADNAADSYARSMKKAAEQKAEPKKKKKKK